MTQHDSKPSGLEHSRRLGFRLGIYVFKDAEVVDFAAPHGVFSVARRFDPELDAFLIADALRPVQAQAGFTVLPNYSFNERPSRCRIRARWQSADPIAWPKSRRRLASAGRESSTLATSRLRGDVHQ